MFMFRIRIRVCWVPKKITVWGRICTLERLEDVIMVTIINLWLRLKQTTLIGWKHTQPLQPLTTPSLNTHLTVNLQVIMNDQWGHFLWEDSAKNRSM